MKSCLKQSKNWDKVHSSTAVTTRQWHRNGPHGQQLCRMKIKWDVLSFLKERACRWLSQDSGGGWRPWFEPGTPKSSSLWYLCLWEKLKTLSSCSWELPNLVLTVQKWWSTLLSFLHGLFQGICNGTCTHTHTLLPSLLIKKNSGFDLALKSTMIIYSTSAYQEIQIWTVLIKGQVWFLPVWWMWVGKAADQTDGGINGIASSSRGFGMRESNALAL